MIDHAPLPVQGKPERRHLYHWMRLEEIYVHNKFDKDGDGAQREDHDKGMREYDLDVWWLRQILQYFDHAKLALEAAKHCRIIDDGGSARHHEMAAQQAMAKAMMTTKGMVESAIRCYGPMPRPGVSRGHVHTWHHPTVEALRG